MTTRTLTLRRAIVLVVVLGLLIPAILITGYTWSVRYDDDIQKRTHELLEQNADILSNGMQEPLWNINQESGKALLDAMMMRNEDIVRIDVRDNALGVFVSAERAERRIGYTKAADKPVNYRGAMIGSVHLEVGSTRLRRIMIEGLTEQLMAVAAQVVLSIILILILLEQRLIRPLQRLGKGAERLAGRQLDIPFTWSRLDEIGLLSRRFEDTRISLRTLFDELDVKNKELQQDIIKRKHVEKELHEREHRYRALVERSPIAIIEWDANYQVIEWNAAAEQIFGYPREQAIGRHANFIVPNSDRATVTAVFNRLSAGNGGIHSINQNIRSDGQMITCQWSNANISETEGRAVRLLSMAEDITEKRRAEHARSLSEAKFAGAFQCNPDSVSITRLSDGVIIDVNQTAESASGWSKEESVGKTSIELDLWVNPEERAALFQQLSRHNLVRDFPVEMRTKSGEIHQCLVNGTLFHVGNELYMLNVARDVTDQRRLEAQKAEADRALMRLAQGTQTIAGESFFDLLIADLASVLRTDCAMICLRDDVEPKKMKSISTHLRGQSAPVEVFDIGGSPYEPTLAGEICVYAAGLRQRFPDDTAASTQNWESYAGAPLRDAAGNFIGVLAVLHGEAMTNPDLVRTLLQVFSERASAELERKRAEEALRSSEQRFSRIFQSTPVAMFVTQVSTGYTVKDVNRAFERMFKYSRHAVLGKSTSQLGLYSNPAERLAVIEELKGSQRTGSGKELWMVTADGERMLVRLTGHTFIIDDEKYGILACQDVTENHRIENEIRELNATLEERVIERTEELQQANSELATTLETLNMAQEELVRSEKLAALGALVAGIAHELNTPIGNSMMVATTLVDQTRSLRTAYARDGGIKRSTLETYIANTDQAGDIMVRNLFRAANLVTSFKQVAMDQTSSQRRRFSLAEVVSELILTLSPNFKNRAVKIDHHIPTTLMLDSYPGPLGQVIANLVNNSLLHGFEGRASGTISIRAIVHANDHDMIELTVSDDGVGIAAINLTRIFDPFFTTKLGAGGSGLGLNITHNIVTGILGGRIRVQSKPGQGASFILSLPTTAPAKHDEDSADQALL